MSAAAIQVEDLHHAYGAVTAVNGISFEVGAGECFGLLGPNGAGKTTTIQAIVGALRPDRGRVTILGEDDPTRPAVRSRIGVVPQSVALYAELTGEENLAFFGKLGSGSGSTPRSRSRD
jgi:ABC-type multidrug transport system ATPase subunit